MHTTPYTPRTSAPYALQRRTWRRLWVTLAWVALLAGAVLAYPAGQAIGGMLAPAPPTHNVWYPSA